MLITSQTPVQDAIAPAVPMREEEIAYDRTTYTTTSFSQSQPARLAAVAHIMGMSPRPAATARVLELGCATGANLIPLASRYPDAQFLGIDISGRQIAHAQQTAATANLGNIRFQHADLAGFGQGEGLFDYIICHGVYSWVPAPVRDAIMRICNENLAEDGVAFVSYNTLPGWNAVQSIRDLMLYRTASIDAPLEKAKAARDALGKIKELASGTAQNIFSNELNMLRDLDDAYLLHDHLEHTNEPCYFKDFVAHADGHGLAYLNDIHFNLQNPIRLPGVEQLLDDAGKADPIRVQQFMDFALNRRFRQSLLVKKTARRRIARRTTQECMSQLHFRLIQRITPDPAPDALFVADWWHSGERIYRTNSAVYSPRSDLEVRMLDWLADDYESRQRSTFTLAGLASKVTAQDMPDSAERTATARLLWDLLNLGMLQPLQHAISAQPVTERPVAWPVARADATRNASCTANLMHESIDLNERWLKLLPLLDGTRTVLQLAATLASTDPELTEQVIADELKKIAANNLLC